jgi:glutathione synthase/RimK-type ligase-like ATP-grasp enzyme
VSVVALATCLEIPEPDVDEELLVAALADEGVEARVVPWDGDARGFDGADRIVLRSTWNYYLAIDRFLGWVDAHAAKLDNSASVVHWSAHKRYLRDLEREGLPTVPTAWFERGEAFDLAAVAGARGWKDVVVKPAVSAGSYSTMRFRDAREGKAFAADLAARSDGMVQPYLGSVDDHGERSVICIDGAITHSVRKNPRFSGGVESVTCVEIADDVRQVAEAALRRFPEPLLYARIDIMRGNGGEPLVSEVELVEPSLFLVHCAEALRRFAKAIARRAAR